MDSLEAMVPGFRQALEEIPGTLQAHRRLQRVLDGSGLDGRGRALVALAVASRFDCDYCAWVHQRVAEREGVCGEDILLAAAGTALARREAAVVRTAARMVGSGRLLRRVDPDPRDTGLLSEFDLAQLAAHVAFTILNCYVLQRLAPARGPASARRFV